MLGMMNMFKDNLKKDLEDKIEDYLNSIKL
jgi:hypothetical protein